MKYYLLRAEYDCDLQCINNLSDAYIRIGEINPQKIPSRYVQNKIKHKRKTKLCKKRLEKMGILNIRKKLNGHCRKSGKYSIRMLQEAAKLTSTKKTANGVYRITAHLPINDYIMIVKETANLLKEIDSAAYTNLSTREQVDDYPFRNLLKNQDAKTVAPIQSNIILRSSVDGDSKKAIEKVKIKLGS